MIGQSISNYALKAHPPLADKILEKLGEVLKLSTMRQRVETILSIPLKRNESGRSLQ